jgi:hypothetical protein
MRVYNYGFTADDGDGPMFDVSEDFPTVRAAIDDCRSRIRSGEILDDTVYIFRDSDGDDAGQDGTVEYTVRRSATLGT